MAKFQFKLNALLCHRRAVEEERERELAAQLRKRMIFQDQLRQMQQTITQSKRDLRDGLVGFIDLDRVTTFTQYSGQVTWRAEQIVVELASVEKHIETARNNLLEASRERQALELLHNRQFEQWQREQTRIEDAELDELVLQRYWRSRQSNEDSAALEVWP